MQSGNQSEATAQSGARKRFHWWRESASNPSLYMLIRELRSALRGCRTVLDVGCGHASPMRFFGNVQLVGVDGYAPALEEARRNRTHDEFVLGDVRTLSELFKTRRFDACVALDVIEHLPKEEGWRMLEQMEELSSKCTVIFTPNGFLPQKSKDGDLQQHFSGWSPGEMQQRGYTVTGMYGPKALRGEYHRISRSPKVFWLLASFYLHFSDTRIHPEKAAAIFCTKRKG